MLFLPINDSPDALAALISAISEQKWLSSRGRSFSMFKREPKKKKKTMYNWKRRNIQCDSCVNVFCYFRALWGHSLSLWVPGTAASYNVNQPLGTAGVFPQQSLNMGALKCLFFVGKKRCPACLGGGWLPVERFFHRKGFFYQVLISEGEEEKTISSHLGQSLEFILGFTKYDTCHILS